MLTAQTKRGARTRQPLRMTESQFVEWAFAHRDVRAEWEDGRVVIMAPVSNEEDDLNGWLLSVMRFLVEQRDLGVMKGPNFMVRFASQKRRRLPDAMFISKARQSWLRTNHLEGAPDLVIEIVSRDSQTRDRRKKFLEYEKAGVREYWIVDPLSKTVEVYGLHRGKFVDVACEKGIWKSAVLTGFFLNEAWLWRRPLPLMSEVFKAWGLS